MKRCDECLYWESEGEQMFHKDDWMGICHRHAPRPQREGYWWALLEIISEQAWKDWPENKKFPDWDEPEDRAWSWWPQTSGSSWCGEFIRKCESQPP